VAFSDSTQFSNFSTFEPGKPQMMVGMIEWLRHRNSGGMLPWLAIFGTVLAGAGVTGALLPRRRQWVLVACAGLLGWSIAVPWVRGMNRAGLPEPKPERKLTRVAIDRTVCDPLLSKAGFIGGKPEGFGIFERWILRLGWFTSRVSGDRVFDSDLIVFFQPRLPVERSFRDRLAKYVQDGGNVLVIDSRENEHSTANSVLFPFKLSLKRPYDSSAPPVAGAVVPARGLPLPQLTVMSALEVEGGMPVAQLVTGAPSIPPVTVAAGGQFGKGSVTVIGFASRFNDANMGVTGDIEPGEALRPVYEFEYELLRRILKQPGAGKLAGAVPATVPAVPNAGQ
jgi:hypothetical protein